MIKTPKFTWFYESEHEAAGKQTSEQKYRLSNIVYLSL